MINSIENSIIYFIEKMDFNKWIPITNASRIPLIKSLISDGWLYDCEFNNNYTSLRKIDLSGYVKNGIEVIN